MKLVIAQRGPGARFYAAPSLVVAGEIFLLPSGYARSRRRDCARDLDEEFGGGFCAGKILAIGDVAGTNENAD